jgi:hypothetical protein
MTAAAFSLLLGSLTLAAPAAPDAATVRTRLDGVVEAKWKTLAISPEAPCDDATFLRRVWLDLAGRVPPALKVREFLDDRDPQKRAKLVDALLAGDEFADHWGRSWAARLTGKRPIRQPNYDGRILQEYLRDQFLANKPYKEIATELICGEGLSDSSGPANFLLRYEAKPTELVGAVSKQFLGSTIQCAQCHDHPFVKWKKDDFWGTAAFFVRVRALQSQDGNTTLAAIVETRKGELEIPDASAKPDAQGNIATKKIKPRLPTDKAPPIDGKRRQALAAWITSDTNPYFARNTVNQVWAQLLGTPLTGDLDRPLIDGDGKHPQVLDLLADDFKAGGYDVKRLLRIIVLSRSYQLSAGSGGKPKEPMSLQEVELRGLKTRNLACYPARPLTVDQLYQAIVQATGHTGEETPPPNQSQEEADEAGAADRPADLLVERALTVQRSLALLNSDYVHKAAVTGAKAAMTVNGRKPGAAHAEWLFLTTLSRRPSSEESAALLEAFKSAREPRGLEDVLWAILNSTEFVTNH